MRQIQQHSTSSTPRESDERRRDGQSVANALLLILAGVAIIAFVLVGLG